MGQYLRIRQTVHAFRGWMTQRNIFGFFFFFCFWIGHRFKIGTGKLFHLFYLLLFFFFFFFFFSPGKVRHCWNKLANQKGGVTATTAICFDHCCLKVPLPTDSTSSFRQRWDRGWGKVNVSMQQARTGLWHQPMMSHLCTRSPYQLTLFYYSIFRNI